MHLYLGLTAKATQRDLASFVLDAKNALLPLNRSDIPGLLFTTRLGSRNRVVENSVVPALLPPNA
jgi:hypothetical protein